MHIYTDIFTIFVISILIMSCIVRAFRDIRLLRKSQCLSGFIRNRKL
uniref:Uncharacterized protein n=1 Tax=Myoviridae sp. ctBoB21 TaxID=2827287 RepID=A0A8S5R5S5_9CAUD|nr:MAG TPA: hypothetical protein [Myoviridae sp. ctBoB21]